MGVSVALVGNPNCGKTALFNALTGSCQRIGNWPGVTVEKKTGAYCQNGEEFDVTDLPGIYSLSNLQDTMSVDAKIASHFLISNQVDVILNVLDGSNLERNLYLTLQLLSMRIPIVIAVNMMDILQKRGLEIDLKKLSKTLGCPVVPIIARKGEGIDQLKKVIRTTAQQSSISDFQLLLSPILTNYMNYLAQDIKKELPNANFSPVWVAQNLLENDVHAISLVSEKTYETALRFIKDIHQEYGEEPDILLASARYEFVHDLVPTILSFKRKSKYNFSQKIDSFVLNRWLGIPIFLLIMYLLFFFAINVGGALQDFFDITSATLFVDGVSHLLMSWHWPVWLIAIIADGVGKGINTTVTFIPVIGAMFLFLSLLEDSGYMARAAFVVDRMMRALGLPGKSFVPMIVGFGCNVPAVMGARTLGHARDRILTILMMPFMSCGARLAIFAVFVAAFFPQGGQDIIFLLYLTGILAAVLTGFLLRKSILPGKPEALIMELPPYHFPHGRSIFRDTWQRLKKFLTRAGSVIIPVCMLIGSLNSITLSGHLVQGEYGHQRSILSAAGRLITPVFYPMGIEPDNWPATVGLMTGVLAKEVVIGTLNTLYSQQAHLTEAESQSFNLVQGLLQAVESVPKNLLELKNAWRNPVLAGESSSGMDQRVYGTMYHYFDGKIGAFSYLLFILLYFPCVSTMAVMRRELNSKWAYFSLGWSTCLAYFSAVFCYQLLTIDRHVGQSIAWLVSIVFILTIFVVWIRRSSFVRNVFVSSGVKK